MIKNTFILALSITLSACIGNNLTHFVRPPATQIVVGSTDQEQVITVMKRKPDSIGQKTYHNQIIDVMEYSYIGTSDEADIINDNYLPIKTQYFYIDKNNKVIGTEFHSSFQSDTTRFDEHSVKNIEKGKSTKQDTIKLLGQPSIILSSTLTSNNTMSGIGYHYRNMQMRSPTDIRTYAAKLIIEFDDKNIVQVIDYESTRNNK